jgi:hypothetical protein
MSSEVKVVKLILAPRYSKLFLQQHNNLGKIMNWWKNHLKSWHGIYLVPKNFKIKKNITDCTLIITYECRGDTEDQDIHDENEMIADPDDDGNYPIYYDNTNDKILYVDPLKIEYVNSTINHKQTIIKLKKIAGTERKAVTLEIHPAFPKPFLEKANNLGKLVDWWKDELDDWPGVKLKVQNLKVKKNKALNSIIITYDCPSTTKDAIIHNENAYFAQPNADDTHPIYYDANDKILSGKIIDTELVSAARIEKEDTLIKTKTKKVRASKKRKGAGTRRRH